MPDALRVDSFRLVHRNLSADTVQWNKAILLLLASSNVAIVSRSKGCVLATGEEGKSTPAVELIARTGDIPTAPAEQPLLQARREDKAPAGNSRLP